MNVCRAFVRKMSSVGQSRGILVVLEGGDYAGKTTQGELLVERLQKNGHSAKFMRFPERTTEIGVLLDSYLKQTKNMHDFAVHLLFSANRWEAEPQILQDLMNGTTLVIDRYAFSGVAYSSAKPGLDIERCKKPDVGLPKPDVTLYFKISDKVFQERRAGRACEERYEQLDFQKRVQANMDLLADPAYWKDVNADKTLEEVSDDVYAIVEQTLQQCGEKPIGRLWEDEK